MGKVTLGILTSQEPTAITQGGSDRVLTDWAVGTSEQNDEGRMQMTLRGTVGNREKRDTSA